MMVNVLDIFKFFAEIGVGVLLLMITAAMLEDENTSIKVLATILVGFMAWCIGHVTVSDILLPIWRG